MRVIAALGALVLTISACVGCYHYGQSVGLARGYKLGAETIVTPPPAPEAAHPDNGRRRIDFAMGEQQGIARTQLGWLRAYPRTPQKGFPDWQTILRNAQAYGESIQSHSPPPDDLVDANIALINSN